MTRAGASGYLFDEFIEKSRIAIGWEELGDLSEYTSGNEVNERFENVYTFTSRGKKISGRSQVKKFRFDFKIGDYVITYDSNQRIYKVGKIIADYFYSDTLITHSPHTRKVEWTGEVKRDDLVTSSKNILGSVLTIFEIPQETELEILELLSNNLPQKDEDFATENNYSYDILKDDAETRAIEFIKDLVSSLEWEKIEELAAGLLVAMGYKSKLTERVGDRGRDVDASPDGLGLETPRIKAEVKHRMSKISSEMIRSFIGGLREGDRGLYISTGGFTKDAKYEADRSTIPCTLVDLDYFVSLLCEYYEQLPISSRVLIPLKKIYWPIST